jgi:hypothetical protein
MSDHLYIDLGKATVSEGDLLEAQLNDGPSTRGLTSYRQAGYR